LTWLEDPICTQVAVMAVLLPASAAIPHVMPSCLPGRRGTAAARPALNQCLRGQRTGPTAGRPDPACTPLLLLGPAHALLLVPVGPSGAGCPAGTPVAASTKRFSMTAHCVLNVADERSTTGQIVHTVAGCLAFASATSYGPVWNAMLAAPNRHAAQVWGEATTKVA
jgi:hypothetical protein